MKKLCYLPSLYYIPDLKYTRLFEKVAYDKKI